MTNISSPSFKRLSEPEKECLYLHGTVWRREYMTEDTYTHLVGITSIESITVIPTILLNALVIFAVTTRPPLRTKSNILLACLAVTDLFTGLVPKPLALAVSITRILGVGKFCTLEKVFVISLFLAGFASLTHLVLISIDRYVAIKDPLRYRDIVTKRRITAGILLAWALSALLTIQEIALAALDSETDIYSGYLNVTDKILAIFASVCIGAIVYMYGYIFSETRRQQKRLKVEQLSQEETKRIKKDRKAANTLAIILATLVFTYLPALITLLLTTASYSIMELRVKCNLWSGVLTFLSMDSVCNPFIYCWRNKKLRRSFLEILHLRQPENSPPVIEMQVIN